MSKRDEPTILADLIRFAERIDANIRNATSSGKLHKAEELERDYQLVEEARAALHRYVVAQGKRDIARPAGDWPKVAAIIGIVGFVLGLITGAAL